MGVLKNSSLIERREDLRGGFMLCFLDDGAGMDSSKWHKLHLYFQDEVSFYGWNWINSLVLLKEGSYVPGYVFLPLHCLFQAVLLIKLFTSSVCSKINKIVVLHHRDESAWSVVFQHTKVGLGAGGRIT